MQIDHAAELAKSPRAYLESPAGYGKTHTIAQAIAMTHIGRQLILTHTHAGVNALRNRLAKELKVPNERYHLDTIAGWSLRYARAYPKASGLHEIVQGDLCKWMPNRDQWGAVYKAASSLLSHGAIQSVVQATYDGLYVDEYQDCTVTQHELIMALANLLPCRILGDRLQGIFDIYEPLADVTCLEGLGFEKLPDLEVPHRWKKTNPALGNWLAGVRKTLLAGGEVDLRDTWHALDPVDYNRTRKVCAELSRKHRADSIVVIHGQPNQCHDFARKSGEYRSMEEFESRELISSCRRLEAATPKERAALFIDFARECIVRLPTTELNMFRKCLTSGRTASRGLEKRLGALVDNLCNVANADDLCAMLPCLDNLHALKGRPFRAELWSEMRRTLRAYESGRFDSLVDAAQHTRQLTSRMGRPVDKRIVSRVFLIKGLEFDHAVILDADKLTRQELYVALTRGAQSLTVFSKEQVIHPSSRRGETRQPRTVKGTSTLQVGQRVLDLFGDKTTE